MSIVSSLAGMFSKVGGAGGIFSTILSTGSTVMKSEYEMYASIAGGVLLLITMLNKK